MHNLITCALACAAVCTFAYWVAVNFGTRAMFGGSVTDTLGRFLGLFIAFASYPTVRLALYVARRIRDTRRCRLAERGLCSQCKYDLRGNVSGVCPECGLAIERTGKGGL